MRKSWIAGIVVLMAVSASAENLIINGSFKAKQTEFPEYWTPSNVKDVAYNRSAGPDGQASVAFVSGKGGVYHN